MPTAFEELSSRLDLLPTPQSEAQQRGYVGQGLAGIARGVTSGVARPLRALSAIPGVRTVAEPFAEGIENLAPYSSGGVLESGIESGVSSLVTGGLTAAGIVATSGAVTPLALAAATGGQYLLAEGAESRQRLEKLNTALSAAGQTPLTTGEIYGISSIRGLIEGGGEALGNYFIGTRLLKGAAAEAVKASIGRFLPGVVGRIGREAAFIGAEELATESGQAYTQALAERSVLGSERVAALEAARQPVAGEPGREVAAVLGPTAISSLLFGGVAAIGGRKRPMQAAGAETQAAVTAPPALQTVGQAAGTEGVLLPPDEAAQARFQAAARDAAATAAAPAQRASTVSPLSPTGSFIPGVPPERVLVPYGTFERDAIPPEVRAEALGQSAIEIQQRLTQIDRLILERGFAGETAPDLQPLRDRQTFYQQILQDRLNEGVSHAGETQRLRVRPLPFELPAGPQDVQTTSELEAGLARRGQGPLQESPALLARRRSALDFLEQGQGPRAPIRGLTQDQAVDALLTQAIETPQDFFANVNTPGGRDGIIRVLTRAGFRPFEAQELLNRTLDLVQEPPLPPGAPPPVSPPPPAPAPTPPPLVPVTPREAPPILPSAPADQATPSPAVAVPEAPRADVSPEPQDRDLSGETPAQVPATSIPETPQPIAQEVPSGSPSQTGLATVDPQSLFLDPERFQYKISPRKGGATGSLRGSKAFNPNLAGVIQVWQDPADGKTYVVNGHNRLDLARRSNAPAINVQYLQAETAQEARAIGALTNIAEGRGSVLDAAKFFRENSNVLEQAQEAGVSLEDRIAREGAALARLHPALFGAVSRGEIPEGRGVAIGQFLVEPADQLALQQLIERQERGGRRVSIDTVRELAELVGQAPTQTTTELTLFGADEQTQNLAVETADLLAYLRNRLTKERRLFGLVSQAGNAASLEQAGNVINVAGSEAVSSQAAQVLAIFDRLKNSTGPVREAVNAAALRIAGGANANTVRQDLYQQLVADLPTLIQGGDGARSAASETVPGAGPPGESPGSESLALFGGGPSGSVDTGSESAPSASVPGAAPQEAPLGTHKGYTITQRGIGDKSVYPVYDAQGQELFTADSEVGARTRIDTRFTPEVGVLLSNHRGFEVRQAEPTFQASDVLTGTGLAFKSMAAARNALRTDQASTHYIAKLGDLGYVGRQRPTGQLQVVEAGRPGRGPVTLEEAQRVFRTQAVSQRDDGVIVVRMPQAGHVLEIHNVAQITPTTTELELGYGQQVLTPTQDVLGRETPMGQGIFRIEVTPERTSQTLYHEGEHFFEDSGLLSQRDIDTLNRTLRRRGIEETAEHRADLVANLLNARELRGGIPGESTLASIGRKVQQFLDKLARLVGLRTTGQIVRSIESGSIFERQGETTQHDAQGRLMVAAFNRGEETGKAAGSVVRDAEGNLQAVYHGTGAMFDEFALEKKGSAAGQMFDGIFFAEDPDVATRYANETRQSLSGPQGTIQDLDTAIRRATQRVQALETARHETDSPFSQRSLDAQIVAAKTGLAVLEGYANAGSNVRPVYLNIQHPFDMAAEVAFDASEVRTVGQEIELQPIIQALQARGWETDYAMERLEAAHERQNLLGSDLYKALAQYVTADDGNAMGKGPLTQALQDVGYDGIFHVGRKDGRVWVAFSPDQIIPAFQAHGRLQVVNKPVPDVTPRKPTYETELKSLAEYNIWAKTLTPEQVAHFQQLNDQGHAFFKKEIIPIAVTDESAMTIVRQWKEDPQRLRAFQTRMTETGDSALKPSAANEAQARALAIFATGQWQFMVQARDAGLLTPEEFETFEGKWLQANNTAHAAAESLSVFGRGLRQSQTESTGLAQFLRKMAELNQLVKDGTITPGQLADLRKQVEAAMLTGDFTALQNVKPEGPLLKRAWWELYYSSLYNVATWSTNLWSTEGHILFQNGLVEPLAGGIDTILSRLGGREKKIFSDVALTSFRENLGRLPQSFKSFWWLWHNDPRAKDIPGFHQTDSITQRELEEKAGAWANAAYPPGHARAGEPIQWMRRLAPVVTATSRALEAMDVAMRQQDFDSRMEALSQQAAQRELGHLDRQWQVDWQKNQVANQGPAFTEALAKSRFDTFHDQASVLANLIIQGRRIPAIGGFIQLLFPFAKTPDRLLARGLELLPGPGFVKAAYQATNIQWDGWLPKVSLNKEALTPEMSLTLAKQMVGTLMAGSIAAMFMQGLITGGVPEDPAEREAFYRSGKIPFSVRVGDTWYSWRRFEPMSLPLSVVISAVDSIDRLHRRQERRGEVSAGVLEDTLSLAAVAAQSITTNILDSSYFAGAAQFLQSTQRGRETGDVPKGVLRQIATMVVPWSSMQRAAIRAVDSLGVAPGTTAGQTLVRQPEGLLEHIDSLVLAGPYLPGGPKSRLDIFGQPQHRITSFLGELLPGMPPVERGYASSSEVEQALARLRYAPGQPAKIDATTGKALPAAEYRRLQEVRGVLLTQRFESLVNTAGFDRLSPDAQKRALQAAVTAAGKQAKREVELETRQGVR